MDWACRPVFASRCSWCAPNQELHRSLHGTQGRMISILLGGHATVWKTALHGCWQVLKRLLIMPESSGIG
eukprot:675020-Karenia_brevis.AAC.1